MSDEEIRQYPERMCIYYDGVYLSYTEVAIKLELLKLLTTKK